MSVCRLEEKSAGEASSSQSSPWFLCRENGGHLEGRFVEQKQRHGLELVSGVSSTRDRRVSAPSGSCKESYEKTVSSTTSRRTDFAHPLNRRDSSPLAYCVSFSGVKDSASRDDARFDGLPSQQSPRGDDKGGTERPPPLCFEKADLPRSPTSVFVGGYIRRGGGVSGFNPLRESRSYWMNGPSSFLLSSDSPPEASRQAAPPTCSFSSSSEAPSAPLRDESSSSFSPYPAPSEQTLTGPPRFRAKSIDSYNQDSSVSDAALRSRRDETGEVWFPYAASPLRKSSSSPSPLREGQEACFGFCPSRERRVSSGLSARLARVAVETAAAQEKKWRLQSTISEKAIIAEAERASAEAREAVVSNAAAQKRLSEARALKVLAEREAQAIREETETVETALAEAEAATIVNAAASEAPDRCLLSFSSDPLDRKRRAAKVASAAVLGYEAEAATAVELATQAKTEASRYASEVNVAAQLLQEADLTLKEARLAQQAEEASQAEAQRVWLAAKEALREAQETALAREEAAREASLAAEAAEASAKAATRVSILKENEQAARTEVESVVAVQLQELEASIQASQEIRDKAQRDSCEALSNAHEGSEAWRALAEKVRTQQEAVIEATEKARTARRLETRSLAQRDRRSVALKKAKDVASQTSERSAMLKEEYLALRLAIHEATLEKSRLCGMASEAWALKAQLANLEKQMEKKQKEKKREKEKEKKEEKKEGGVISKCSLNKALCINEASSSLAATPAVSRETRATRRQTEAALENHKRAFPPLSVSARRKRRSSNKEASTQGFFPSGLASGTLTVAQKTEASSAPSVPVALPEIPLPEDASVCLKAQDAEAGVFCQISVPPTRPLLSASLSSVTSALSSFATRASCAGRRLEGGGNADDGEGESRVPSSADRQACSASAASASISRSVALDRRSMLSSGTASEEASWRDAYWEGVGWLRVSETKLGQGTFGSVYEAQWRRDLQTDETRKACCKTSRDEEAATRCVCRSLRVIPLALKQYRAQASAPYQFLREEALLRHYNAHVIKPISTRSFRERVASASSSSSSSSASSCQRTAGVPCCPQGSRIFQLLLPRAHGDLQQLIKKVILNRARAKLLIAWYKEHALEEAALCDEPVSTDDGESAEKKELWSVYGEVGPCGLTEFEAKFVFAQLLSGGAFLHLCCESEVARLVDVKLSNLLVFCKDSEELKPLKWLVALADLGSAIVLHPRDHLRAATPWKSGLDEKKSVWEAQVRQQQICLTQGTLYTNPPEALRVDANGRLRKPEAAPAFPLLPRKRFSPTNAMRTEAVSAATKTSAKTTTRDETQTGSSGEAALLGSGEREKQQSGRNDDNDKASRHYTKTLNRRSASDSSFLGSCKALSGVATALIRQQQADSWSFGVTLCELVKGGGCCCPTKEETPQSKSPRGEVQLCVCQSADGSLRFEAEAREAREILKRIRAQVATTKKTSSAVRKEEKSSGQSEASSVDAKKAVVSAQPVVVSGKRSLGEATSQRQGEEEEAEAFLFHEDEEIPSFDPSVSKDSRSHQRLRLPSCVANWVASHPKYSKFWTAVQELLCHVGFGLFVAPSSLKKLAQNSSSELLAQPLNTHRQRKQQELPSLTLNATIPSSVAEAPREKEAPAESSDDKKGESRRSKRPLWVEVRQAREKEQEEALTSVAARASPRWMGKPFECLHGEEKRQLRKLVLAFQLAKVAQSTCGGSLTSRAKALRHLQETMQHSRCTSAFWMVAAHLLAYDASQRLLLAEVLGLQWFAPLKTKNANLSEADGSDAPLSEQTSKRRRTMTTELANANTVQDPGAAANSGLQKPGLSSECVFSLIDGLEAFSRNHLPCEHNSQRVCRLRYNAAPSGPSAPSKDNENLEEEAATPLDASVEDSANPKNNAMRGYGEVKRRPHAWYAGALLGLQLLGKTDTLSSPSAEQETGNKPPECEKQSAFRGADVVSSVAIQEASVLQWNESHIWRSPGILLKILKRLQRQERWGWTECSSSLAAHYVGRVLLHHRQREATIAKDSSAPPTQPPHVLEASASSRWQVRLADNRVGVATVVRRTSLDSKASFPCASSRHSKRPPVSLPEIRGVKRLLASSDNVADSYRVVHGRTQRTESRACSFSFKENQAP